MEEPKEDRLLLDLLAKVKYAWVDHRDRRLVEALVVEHPQYTDDLYAFFDDMVEAEDYERNRPGFGT